MQILKTDGDSGVGLLCTGRQCAVARRLPVALVCWMTSWLLGAALSSKALPEETESVPPGVQELQKAVIRAIERAEPSVVAVARVYVPPARVLGRPLDGFGGLVRSQDLNSPDFVPNEFGSGVALKAPDGNGELLILTNYHVVVHRGRGVSAGRADRILVRWSGSPYVTAKIVAADRRSDLAVLRPELSQAGTAAGRLKPAVLGDASALKKGQFVIVLGNPYALARDGSPSASWGLISNIRRFPAPTRSQSFPYAPFRDTFERLGLILQIDVRLPLGTSGGALLNLKGELIGLTTSLAALEGYDKTSGYAIPLTPSVRRIIESLMRGQEPEYGFLGIEPGDGRIDARIAAADPAFASTGILAVRVVRVLPNSPAARAGLATGDLILTVNGRPVHGKYDLMREVGLLEPNSIARLRVWRRLQQTLLTLPVKLGKWPLYDDRDVIVTQPRYALWRGLRVDYPTARRRFLLGPDTRYPDAVVVTRVEKTSPAERAGLHEGDFITHVDDVPVRTPRDFYDVVTRVMGPARLRLWPNREVTLTENDHEN
ncbi:MAG: PDZ domain-containing protein [Planctomycetes bacterium]|nr:PDZ domain-containing protein [Planctomycetota bacterium]